eukprot:TRINITY_DN14572_c0_g1_i1.p1 TRINITY_DN14572_c0_g1~~TRINITY_DN14572_c0_g1_i1.p1  ORF type:complete len:325 (+),score=54.21 TRINITY_DN14572_c0_g1_i1:30-1004(+)
MNYQHKNTAERGSFMPNSCRQRNSELRQRQQLSNMVRPLIFLLFAFICCIGTATCDKVVMPWMCMDICDNTTEIEAQLQQIIEHKLEVVAFERYFLCEGGILCNQNVSEINSKLLANGIKNMPMLSSYPHPTDFLDRMRSVWNDPAPFIASALQEAERYNYYGYNVDWEPTVAGTQTDAIAFAEFLSLFADSLHAVGRKLTVATGSWNPVWNMTLMAQTTVDKFLTMQTYANNFTVFEADLIKAVEVYGVNRLGVGLCTCCGPEPLSTDAIAQRFQVIKQYNIQEIDIWDEPIFDNWWPFINAFRSGTEMPVGPFSTEITGSCP